MKENKPSLLSQVRKKLLAPGGELRAFLHLGARKEIMKFFSFPSPPPTPTPATQVPAQLNRKPVCIKVAEYWSSSGGQGSEALQGEREGESFISRS